MSDLTVGLKSESLIYYTWSLLSLFEKFRWQNLKLWKVLQSISNFSCAGQQNEAYKNVYVFCHSWENQSVYMQDSFS